MKRVQRLLLVGCCLWLMAPSKFDEEVYLLSYQTYLANKNLSAAEKVAKSAVAQNPKNIEWRRRLAIVARWNNHSQLSFGTWYQLAMETHSQESIREAMTLAEGLNEPDALANLLRMKLQQDPNDLVSMKKLATLEERLGYPNETIKLLEELQKKSPNPENLKTLATLYEQLGQTQHEMSTLKKLQTNKSDSGEMIFREAKLLYSKGLYEGAYSTLKENESQLSDQNDYWEMVADLAWQLNDAPMAEKAYRKLWLIRDKTDFPYDRLLQLVDKRDAAFRYQVASEGWNRTHNASYLFQILDSGVATENWQGLNTLFNSLRSQDEAALVRYPYYWTMRATVAEKLGQIQNAQNYYQHAIKLFPEQADLRLSYGWFLLNNANSENSDSLLAYVANWQHDFAHNAAFTGLYNSILTQLGYLREAVEETAKGYAKHKNNVVWLNQFAELLDNYTPNAYSHLLRLRAWMIQHSWPNIHNAELNKAIAELAMKLDPGETALMAIYRTHASTEFRTHLIDWSLNQSNYDLAHFLRDNWPAKRDTVPLWADLSLSLHDVDRERVSRILRNKTKQILPYADVVSANQLLNELPTAETVAFENLQTHPMDDSLYNQFTELMQLHANSATIAMDYDDRDGVAGFYPKMQFRYFVTKGSALLIDANKWNVHTTPSTVLATPSTYYHTAIGVLHLLERGTITGMLGTQHAFKQLYYSTVHFAYRITDRFSLNTDLAWNNKTEDTTELELAGVQDNVQLQGIYRINEKQQVVSELQYNWLRDQDRELLSHSRRVYLAFEHKLLGSYPDVSVRLYDANNRYNTNNHLPAFLTQFDRSGMWTIETLVSPSYNEYGITLQWNEVYRTSYTKRWRPFVVGSLFQNSVTGKGYYAVAGISGRAFGHDHLSMYVEQSQGQNSQSGLRKLIGIRYSRYF